MREQRAFTLIELVISIGILGLIMTVAYASLDQIMRGKATLDDRRDGNLIANAILTRITRELQLVYAPRGESLMTPCGSASSGTNNRLNTVLRGEKRQLPNGARGDSLIFRSGEGGQYLPDGGGHSGVVQIRYGVESNRVGNNNDVPVVSFIREEVPDIQPFKKACESRMLFAITPRLTTLQFEYFDEKNQRWVDEWGEPEVPKRLSLLVSFDLP